MPDPLVEFRSSVATPLARASAGGAGLAATRIVLIYAGFAALWILVSDRLLMAWVEDPRLLGWIGMLKGWFFIAVTALLLHGLIRLDRQRLERAHAAQLRSEEALKRSTERLLWLGDNLPESYVYQYTQRDREEPRYLYLSAGAANVHQLTVDEILADANRLQAQIDPEQVAAIAAKARVSRDQLTDFEAELRIVRPDGTRRWLHLRSRPRREADGQVIWDGIAADITDRKTAEEARRASEERLRIVTGSARVGLVLVDREHRYVFANGTYAEILELPSADIVGRRVADVLAGVYADQIRPRLDQAFGGERVSYQLRRPTGGMERHYAVNYEPTLTEGKVSAVVVVITDITEIKVAEEKIRAHEALLRETGRIAKVGGWSFDVATGAGEWTEEVARIHDLDPAAPTSRAIGLEFYQGESRRKIEAALAAAVQHGEGYDLELELTTAAGARKWVRTIGNPVREDGRVVRLRGSFQDVTERHRLDAERERQQRRLALLADISRGLVLSDSPGALVAGVFEKLSRELQVDVFANYMVSPEGDRLRLESSGGLTETQQRDFAELPFDVSRCDPVAERKERMLFADLPSVQVPQAAGIIALGVQAYAGFPLLAGDRLIGTISFGSRSLREFPADDVRLMKTVADQVAASVERSRLLEAWRAGEERFRQVVESIQEVFWMLELDGRRFSYVSPAFETIWGRGVGTIRESAARWEEFIHPEDRPRVVEAARTRQAHGTYRETYRIVRPDGTVRWVHERAFPVHEADGRVRRIVGVTEDVTEKRELESRFLRSQRLEAIGTLAGGISHDLNNILSPVLMIASLLKGRLEAPDERRLLELLESSALRGAGIIRQLLTFSRGTVGGLVTVQVRHLVKEIVELMQETLPRDISVRAELEPGLLPVTGDPTQLHQVLLNLCVNARDAMPRGGELVLRAGNLELTPDAAAQAGPDVGPGRYIVITVEDNGQGIAPENLVRIFDPFFTTKEPGRGTGLGLSTVHGIVKSHGGFVTVRSQPGQGASFAVYLPVSADEAEKSSGAAVMAAAPGNGQLILVVDDEPNVAMAIRLLLETSGYRVVTAADGREALTRFMEQQDAVKLVVTDSMMPVMDGTALIRALRALRPELKIIAITGLEQDGQRQEMQRLGVAEMLPKPCGAAEILRAVGSALA